MADFAEAQAHLIEQEGGYVLSNHENDRGGETFAGISRRWWPDWGGWKIIDSGTSIDPRLETLTDEFYHETFWQPINGDRIASQDFAEALYSSAVLSGARTAVKLLQRTTGARVDGIMGERTLKRINGLFGRQLLPLFTLLRIARYAAICNKDKSQVDNLLGWINRALEEDGRDDT